MKSATCGSLYPRPRVARPSSEFKLVAPDGEIVAGTETVLKVAKRS